MLEKITLELKDVDYAYSNNVIFKNLNLKIYKRDKILLLGRNGSGKSTLLKIASKLVKLKKGSISTDKEIKLSYLGHKLQLYPKWSAKENISYRSRLINDNEKIQEKIESWELQKTQNKLIENLSQGLKQRVALANSFTSEINLFLLDEPTTALDTHSTNLFLNKIIKEELSFIIASHDIMNLENIINRVIVIDKNTISYDSRDNNDIKAAIDYYLSINK